MLPRHKNYSAQESTALGPFQQQNEEPVSTSAGN
jgi:hypothetical protein